MDNDYITKLSSDIQSANLLMYLLFPLFKLIPGLLKYETGKWNWELREPNAFEIKLMVNLSVLLWGKKAFIIICLQIRLKGYLREPGLLNEIITQTHYPT